jgi:thiol-disulfide isomerase/thioredoxin
MLMFKLCLLAFALIALTMPAAVLAADSAAEASAVTAESPRPIAPRPAKIGEAVQWPDVEMLDGSRFNAERAKGRTVIVVFWATTCPFCKRHNAHIDKLRRAAEGRPLEIVTVARDKDPQAVRRYLAANGYGFGVTMAQAPMAAALHERRVIPLTVVVGPDGNLREVVPGEMFEEDVMQWLEKL